MVIVYAELKAKPGRGEALENVLLGLFPEVRKEEGVANYILHRHAEDKERFFFYERYASVAAKDAHMETPHLRAALAEAEGLLACPPVVETYEDVAEIEKKLVAAAEYACGVHNGQAVWGRADLLGRQKEYCLCWACGKFEPGAEDKGCSIIRAVLGLAAEKGVVLPVWACPAFFEKGRSIP